MSRIELRPAKPKPLRCAMCGRVRLDQTWAYVGLDPGETAVVTRCPTCNQQHVEAQQREARRQDRQLLANRRRGFGPPKDGEDVWRGFREEEK